MAVRNLVLAEENHVQMEGVAGSPDTALAIDEALQSLLQNFSACVESAQRHFLSIGYFYVSN